MPALKVTPVLTAYKVCGLESCAIKFLPARHNQVYCSDAHRGLAWRLKHSEDVKYFDKQRAAARRLAIKNNKLKKQVRGSRHR